MQATLRKLKSSGFTKAMQRVFTPGPLQEANATPQHIPVDKSEQKPLPGIVGRVPQEKITVQENEKEGTVIFHLSSQEDAYPESTHISNR